MEVYNNPMELVKTAIILPTALGTTLQNNREEVEKRINQYTSGFYQVSQLCEKFSKFDLFLVDTTIADLNKLDDRILQSLDQINSKERLFSFDNEAGKKNKGAGLITQWKKVLPYLGDYEYIISFEPRQKLINFEFFEKFLSKKGNHFRIDRIPTKRLGFFPYTLVAVYTGLFSLKREYLQRYCQEVSIERMLRWRISIETDMYKFLKKNHIYIKEQSNLNLIWNNPENRDLPM